MKLYYFDECGFAPSLPTNASWCLPGQRKHVPYEYPSGRRVNALAAYEPLAAEPWLGSRALERTPTSADVLAYLRSLPAAAVPRVVVLDNAGIHTVKRHYFFPFSDNQISRSSRMHCQGLTTIRFPDPGGVLVAGRGGGRRPGRRRGRRPRPPANSPQAGHSSPLSLACFACFACSAR
ncbi:MAG TPA: transposase [Gemmataceae bacterium]|nr:transposase [Gemmataceae bacterium]